MDKIRALLGAKFHIQWQRKVKHVAELSLEETQAYQSLVGNLNHEQELLEIQELIRVSPTYIDRKNRIKRLSGRDINEFLTSEQHEFVESYDQHMNRYGKAFFDAFNRTGQVWHQLHDNTYIPLCISKTNLYLWAQRKGVFTHMHKYYATFKHINRQTKKTGQQKRRNKKRKSLVTISPTKPAIRRKTISTPKVKKMKEEQVIIPMVPPVPLVAQGIHSHIVRKRKTRK